MIEFTIDTLLLAAIVWVWNAVLVMREEQKLLEREAERLDEHIKRIRDEQERP